MCGSLFGSSSAPKQTQVAPTAQQVVKDEAKNVDKVAADRERRRKGMNSTILSDDRINTSILGSVAQASDAFKKTLGG